MTRLRIILWIIFLLLWFIGDFLPILPWPLLSYIAVIFFEIADKNCFTTTQIVILWIFMALVTAVDYITPIIWTKKMWWTKRWTRWSTIWLIVWVIILPLLGIVLWPFGLIWLLWWPFVWAYIWEILYQKKNCPPLLKGGVVEAEGDLKSTKKKNKKSSAPQNCGAAPSNKGAQQTEWQIINHKKALKAALWSFIWFLWWIFLKIVFTIIVTVYLIPRIRFAIWHKSQVDENYREVRESNYTTPQEFKIINKWQYYKIKFEDTKISYSTWENRNKRFSIKDTSNDLWSCHRNNKPVSLTTEKWKLFINILDSCGWWSWDWYVSKMEVKKDWKLKLVWCYRYDNRWQFETEENNENWNRYFEWTTQYEKLNKTELSDCDWNFNVIYYNNIK